MLHAACLHANGAVTYPGACCLTACKCTNESALAQYGVPGALGALILGHLKHCGHFETADQVHSLSMHSKISS